VDGGFVDDPASYDPYAPPMDRSYLPFESDGITLRQIWSELHGSQFAHLSPCESLPELARAISQVPHLEWTWIDLYIGLELEMAPLEHDPGRSSDVWEAAELWDRCLAPWLPWVT
jgi:hypothetical protein